MRKKNHGCFKGTRKFVFDFTLKDVLAAAAFFFLKVFIELLLESCRKS